MQFRGPSRDHKIRLRNYTHHSLHTDEKIIYIAHVHWIVYMHGLSYVVFSGFFSAVMPFTVKNFFGDQAFNAFSLPIGIASASFLLAGLMLLLGAYIRRHFTELAITDRRMIGKRGLISRESYEVMLERASGIHYDQTTLGRFLDYGNIHIMTAGATIAKFDDMEYPHYFTDLLTTMLEKKREEAKESETFSQKRSDH